jgi:hypothetical protein
MEIQDIESSLLNYALNDTKTPQSNSDEHGMCEQLVYNEPECVYRAPETTKNTDIIPLMCKSVVGVIKDLISGNFDGILERESRLTGLGYFLILILILVVFTKPSRPQQYYYGPGPMGPPGPQIQ